VPAVEALEALLVAIARVPAAAASYERRV